jgi:uncharacterized repeat protein (TIGR03847 family)
MAEPYDMNPCDRLTVGTLGEPGNRTFYLQGVYGLESYAVVIEKEQANALAQALEETLSKLEDDYELRPARADRVAARDLEMQLPIEERFRVTTLGIGYESTSGMLVISCEGGDATEEMIVRYWITRDQGAALIRHTRSVIAGGRPICPLCGQAMDPEGHFCPRQNGHSAH